MRFTLTRTQLRINRLPLVAALLLSLVALCSHAAPASSTPTNATAPGKALQVFDNQYKTRLYGFNITVTNRLSHLGDNNYELLFRFDSMLGSISENTQVTWNGDKRQVVPQHYVYKRRGLGKNRDADLRFDWGKKTVTNHVQASQWHMAVVDKVQDKLSYQLQLQQDFLKGNATRVTYQIADGGHLKNFNFEKIAEEVLDTPLGKVKTIKIKRSREDDERVTHAWLAPQWNNLLVRLEQIEKGSSYTIDITKASLNGKAITQF